MAALVPHTHRYQYPDVFMLTLPDSAGYYEAFLSWQCLECPHRCHATGMVHQQSRGLTVDAWEAQVAVERQAGGLLARQAAKEERRKVR